MRLVARFKDYRDILFVRDILRLCGPKVSERDFTKAAVLHYCHHLLKEAHKIREEAINKAKNEVSNERASADVDRTVTETQSVLPVDSAASSDQTSSVANT